MRMIGGHMACKRSYAMVAFLAVVGLVVVSSDAEADSTSLCKPHQQAWDRSVASGEQRKIKGEQKRLQRMRGACPDLLRRVDGYRFPEPNAPKISLEPKKAILRAIDKRVILRPVGSIMFGSDTRSARNVFFSPHGRYILITDADNTARLWDAKTASFLSGPLPHFAHDMQLSFSDDERFVATSLDSDKVQKWSVPDGRAEGPPIPTQTQPRRLLFLPGSHFLVTEDHEGKVLLENENGEFSPNGLRNRSFSWMSSASEHHYAITSSGPREFEIFDLYSGRTVGERMNLPNGGRYLSPGGSFVGVNMGPGFQIWDVYSGRSLAPPIYLDEAGGFNNIQFSRDNAIFLASAGGETRVVIGDLRSGRRISIPKEIERGCYGAALSPDGRLIMCVGGSIELYEIKGFRKVGSADLAGQFLVKGAFSPDSRFVVALSGSRSAAQIWRIEEQ